MNGNIARLIHAKLRAAAKKLSIPRDREKWPQAWKTIPYKTYDRMPYIALPQPTTLSAPLSTVLDHRHSTRSFSDQHIPLETLSTLLTYAAGERTRGASEQILRRYPSAGARYPLEIYILAKDIEGVAPGLYHFNVRDRTLEHMADGAVAHTLDTQLSERESNRFIREAPATLIISAVWERYFMKYQDYGYRLTLLEAGHLSQNIQLVSEACGLAYCSYVGRHEQEADTALDIGDHRGENVIYFTTIGYSKDITTDKTTEQSIS